MKDFYTEQLVKQKATTGSLFVKTALIAVTLASLFIVLMYPIAMIVPVILLVVDFVMFKRYDLEYEYMYINGDLDIDKIMAKEKRKKVFETNVRDMKVIAPSDSIELQQYKSVKAYDYSSRREGAKTYELVTTVNGQDVRVIFEPNETILEGMKVLAPRKVFI